MTPRNCISAEEWQLTSFFEIEPKFLDPRDPWPYTDATFETVRGRWRILFAVAPAYLDVTLQIWERSELHFDFSALSVNDVEYALEYGEELLRILLTNRQMLTLRLKPALRITLGRDPREKTLPE